LPNSEAVLSLLGWNLLSGGETALTRCVRTVTAHALAHLLQAIITHARSAVTGLYAACAQYTVIRRAAFRLGRLIVVSAYLPRVSVAGRATALNAGRWAGGPAKGLQPQARGRARPAPTVGAARGGTRPLPGGREDSCRGSRCQGALCSFQGTAQVTFD
jgi:hypothetical protein